MLKVKSVFFVGGPKLFPNFFGAKVSFFSQNTKFSFKHISCIALVVQKSLHFLLVPVAAYVIEFGNVAKLWSLNSVSGGRYVHMKSNKRRFLKRGNRVKLYKYG